MNLSSALILLNILPGVVGATLYENAVQKEDDFAICGNNIQGCVSASWVKCAGYAKGILGSIDGIGSSRQKWNFENGFLKSTQLSKNWQGQSYQACMAPYKLGASKTLEDNTHYMKEHKCPDNEDNFEASRHMRFTVKDDRVVSLAHVQGGDEGSYCMTVGNSWYGTKYIVLTTCDEDNDYKQSFETFGNSDPFLYTLEQKFGTQDQVQLAYHAGTGSGETGSMRINFYTAENTQAPAYSQDVSETNGGIVTVDVSQYLDGESGSYIAKLESSDSNIAAEAKEKCKLQSNHDDCGTDATFIVTGATHEDHDDDEKKACEYGPWPLVFFLVAFTLMPLAFWARHRRRENAAPTRAAATAPPKMMDVDDNASQATEESNESIASPDSQMVDVDV